MTRALERHEAGEARVVPIILRPVDWQSARFARLQALPTGGRAVTAWPDRDAAFLDVVRGIRAALAELRGDRRNAPSEVRGLTTAGLRGSKRSARIWLLAGAAVLAATLSIFWNGRQSGRPSPSAAELQRIFAGGATDAELFGRLALRLVDDSREGRQVSFDHDFRSGDYFRFEVNSSRDGWLYVFHRPPGGELALLRPARATGENRVRAFVPARVPIGEEAFLFTDDTGEEYFYVALATTPTSSAVAGAVEGAGQIRSLIASGLHGSAVGGQRRGVVVARPGAERHLFFTAAADGATAAVEMRLKHRR